MRVRFDGFVLDKETRQLLRGTEDLQLTPKAFALLDYLVEQRPRALSKSQILQHVWPATFVSESNLASLVKEIRRALDDDADDPRFVRTVYGFGYAFAGDAEAQEPPATAPRGRTRLRILWNRRELPLAPGDNVLGRTHEATICVDHSSVSRRHAVIRVTGTAATLEDCSSKNGTLLNGHRIETPQLLCDGDTIHLGRARLVFEAFSSDIPTPTAVSAEG
jgi:DNA-binding winged helix-turn-helix (wHTH) protein